MQVLLIHLTGEEENAERTRSLIEKMKARVEILPAGSLNGLCAAMDAYIDKEASAALILSSLPSLWYGFLAGYSRGSRLPFLVYGEKAISSIPEEVSSCFILINTENGLLEILEAENDAFKKTEADKEISIARGTLLDMGIPVNEESMAACAAEGSTEKLSLFLTAGFSPDTMNKTGVPLLNISARKGKLDALRLLVKSGATLDLRAKDRESSALIDSAMGRHLDLAYELIEAGADVNIRDRDGQSALILAAANGDTELALVLLKAGAKADIPDCLGQSARQYAELFGRGAIIEMMNSFFPVHEVLQCQ